MAGNKLSQENAHVGNCEQLPESTCRQSFDTATGEAVFHSYLFLMFSMIPPPIETQNVNKSPV